MASFIDRAGALAATASEIARLKGSEHEAWVCAQAKASLMNSGNMRNCCRSTSKPPTAVLGRELPVSSLLALGSRRAGVGQVG